MKRLPPLAALLLLFAVVWSCMTSTQIGQNADTSSIPQDGRTEVIQATANQLASHFADPIAAQDSFEDATSLAPAARPRRARGIPITPEFVKNLATSDEEVSFLLPDGRKAQGTIEQQLQAADGSPAGASGRLDAPGKGTFHFRLQPTGGVIGAVVIEGAEIAFRVMPERDSSSRLTALPVDQVICRNYTLPPQETDGPQEIPADHPTDEPTPAYQNGIISLQNLPGAQGVIYLDFDGENGPHEGWGDFEAAAPSGMTPAKVMNIWTRVSEDFAPFNLNVTTDLQVFLSAQETSRQRCIITTTRTAAPNAGGVAYTGSFGWGGDTPCWCFYSSSSKFTAEIISHEIGHTLGLSHDGRINAESYYLGHGTDLVGWAPIMGASYYKNLTQWSKGEYSSASQSQDDMAIIAANPGVGLVSDDAGDTQTTAAALEIYTNGSTKSQGNISTQADVDAFSFTTRGGPVLLAISPVPHGPNLDILAGLYDALGNLVISDHPDLRLDATLSATLAAGSYTVRVNGTGRGNPNADGYTDYGSLGQYTITGTISGAVAPDRFLIAENSPVETFVGTPTLANHHGDSQLIYQIVKGNTNSTFKMNRKNGTITVANPSFLDFETQSRGWNDPADFDLTVEVTDSQFPNLSESLRVVITIQDIEEANAEIAITNRLSIPSTQTFAITQNNLAFQGMENNGTLVVTTSLNVAGDATNHGVLRLYGDTILNVAGNFINHGVIDIINWNGTLPASMINTGKILDRAVIRVVATSTSTTRFTLSVPGFAGHLYQLESTPDLTSPWSLQGVAVAGTGDAQNPQILDFAPDLSGPRQFYRVAVTPAP